MRNGADGNDGQGGAEGAGAQPRVPPERASSEPERSPSGKVIIRSSSHPPAVAPPRPPFGAAASAETHAEAGSGVRELPGGPEHDDGRRKKATPKERPRRARRHARERARHDTPGARPSNMRAHSLPPATPPDHGEGEPSIILELPGTRPASGVHVGADVPIQQRSSAPPRRRVPRSPAVRVAIVAAIAIVLSALLLSALR